METNQSWDEQVLEGGHMLSAKGGPFYFQTRMEELLGQWEMGI